MNDVFITRGQSCKAYINYKCKYPLQGHAQSFQVD